MLTGPDQPERLSEPEGPRGPFGQPQSRADLFRGSLGLEPVQEQYVGIDLLVTEHHPAGLDAQAVPGFAPIGMSSWRQAGVVPGRGTDPTRTVTGSHILHEILGPGRVAIRVPGDPDGISRDEGQGTRARRIGKGGCAGR